jgi:hypothetical protein
VQRRELDIRVTGPRAIHPGPQEQATDDKVSNFNSRHKTLKSAAAISLIPELSQPESFPGSRISALCWSD